MRQKGVPWESSQHARALAAQCPVSLAATNAGDPINAANGLHRIKTTCYRHITSAMSGVSGRRFAPTTLRWREGRRRAPRQGCDGEGRQEWGPRVRAGQCRRCDRGRRRGRSGMLRRGTPSLGFRRRRWGRRWWRGGELEMARFRVLQKWYGFGLLAHLPMQLSFLGNMGLLHAIPSHWQI